MSTALPAETPAGEKTSSSEAPAETVELVPLAEVDAVVKLAALLDPRLLAAPLPTEYKFRMKEVRVKRARPAKDLTLQCKLDVSECWMAYVPGCFVQPWGYRRALMGDMQDQPLLSLTPENYPSLEFLEEAPARGSARRLEFAHEHRNGGGARRLYRPMMCAADVLRFLGTEFAQRAGGASGAAGAAGARAPSVPAPDEKKRLGREHEHVAHLEPRRHCEAAEKKDHHAREQVPRKEGSSSGPSFVALPGERPQSAPSARLWDLERRVRAHAAADDDPGDAATGPSGPLGGPSGALGSPSGALGSPSGALGSPSGALAARKRRRLAHEARFLHRSALVDAYASLLEELRAGD